MRLTNHLHLVPSLGMSEAVPSLLLYVFYLVVILVAVMFYETLLVDN